MRSLADIVEGAHRAISPLLDPDRPAYFFGHSMGAMVAFLLAHRLRSAGEPTPRRLLLSGRRAPHLSPLLPPMRELPDDRFLDELEHRYGAQPLLREPELAALFLPVLRADLEALETYRFEAKEALEMPFELFASERDRAVPVEDVSAWRTYTRGEVVLHRMSGGHHYFMEELGPLMEKVRRAIETP